MPVEQVPPTSSALFKSSNLVCTRRESLQSAQCVVRLCLLWAGSVHWFRLHERRLFSHSRNFCMRQKGAVAISSGSRSRLVDGEASSVAGLDINFQCCCDRIGTAAGDTLRTCWCRLDAFVSARSRVLQEVRGSRAIRHPTYTVARRRPSPLKVPQLMHLVAPPFARY